MRLQILYLLITLTSFLFHVYAQVDYQERSKYHTNVLSTDDGLSHGKVNAICRDKDGFIWFGTNEGLNRYDGYNMKVYKNDPNDSMSLTNNFIRALLKDSNGDLWVGTYEGLCIYNYDLDNFTEIKFENDNNQREYVWKIIQDKEGIIWVATTEGLYYVDADHKVAKLFDKIPHLAERPIISAIYIDSLDNLLILSRTKGLYFYNLKTGSYFIRFADPKNPGSLTENFVESIFEVKKGLLWLGMNNSGINIFDYSDSSFTQILIDEGNPYALRVRSIVKDRQGRIWFGTRNGLYLKENMDADFYQYAKIGEPVSFLTNNSIYEIFIDEYDIMWMGTYAGGVNYFDFNQKKFMLFTAKENDNRFLNDNIIYNITEDKNGNLWIGTERGGLNYYDYKTGRFTYFTHDPKNPNSIISDNIKAVLIDSIGNLWIGCYQGGLDYYNTKTKNFTHYTPTEIPNDDYAIQEDRVYSMMYDSDGNLWLGMGSGIDIIKRGSRQFTHLTVSRKNYEILEDNLVLCIFEDTNKEILIGTYRGFYKYNEKDTSFTLYRENFKSEIINTIHEDKKGQLWIGGANGLFFLNRGRDTVIHYTEQEGLPINTIYRIIDDKEGNLWISTSSGLSKYIDGVNNPYIPNFRNYDAEDGLQGKLFINNFNTISPSGRIYLGGTQGFNSFYPEEIKDNPHKPRAVITNIKIFNKDVKVGEEIEGKVVLYKSITNTEKLNLSYKHRVFTLEFTSLHFAKPEKNQYKYMLDGFDQEWITTSSDQRYANYTNLHRGEYTFMVYASNNDGEWSDEPAMLQIKIIPPFYSTWLFRILGVVLVVLSAILYYRHRVNRYKKEQLVLEKKISERTKDLKLANQILEEQKITIAKAYDNIKLLSEIGQKITSSLNMNELNRMIFEHVGALMDVSIFGVGIYNKDNRSIDFPQLIENGQNVSNFSSFLSDKTSAAAWCFINSKPILCNNFMEEYTSYISELNIRTTRNPESIIYIPLIFEENKIGVLTIQSYQRDAYSQNDFAILKTLALYIAIALNNANIYKQLENQNYQLENQTQILNETNTLLEERQQQIEEQAEELRAQKEELEHHQEKIIKQAKKLEEANNNLQELNSTKDKFFSIIAHDLKNPFQTILGFAELLEKKYNSLTEEKVLKYVQSINLSSKNVYRLLENLLDWARIQTGTIKFNRKAFNLSHMIDETVSLFKDVARTKNISLKLICDEEMKVFADYEMVMTVVRNLISNALKFTKAGGEVLIEVLLKGHLANISVKDNGVGISSDNLEKIFRIDASFSKPGTEGEAGTGLGLMLCKEFVEKNGGKIKVKSEIGKGSDFSFTIPVIQD
ncbi:MAG: GAF domain-containing protein [Bacteroidales bacterium]|nr:GAF domain-containing protein [Bacteroidales bacterium]